MHDEYDRSGKWLLEHHGNALLWLGGVHRPIHSWRALAPEVVQPKQLPDGLLEVVFEGQTEPVLFLVEIATYADARVQRQMLRDTLLVFLDRGTVPEGLTLVLCPRGNVTVRHAEQHFSATGTTRLEVSWNVVELWRLPAEELLAAQDVGLVPWALLARPAGPPEAVLRACRERIDRHPEPAERATLLAVAQVLAGLRYNDFDLLRLFGGPSMLRIESPVITRLVANVLRQSITDVLEVRFGPIPAAVNDQLEGVEDTTQLRALVKQVGVCPDLEAFRVHLNNLPDPAPEAPAPSP